MSTPLTEKSLANLENQAMSTQAFNDPNEMILVLIRDLRAARAAIRGILPAASAFALLAPAKDEAEAALAAARAALPPEVKQ